MSGLSGSMYCSDADDQVNLLRKALSVILSPVAHNGGTGLASRNEAAQPQTCGFFVRKILAHHIMASWAEHSREWPVASPVRQLCSVRHPMIGVIRRRVYNLIREAIMSQNKSAHNSEQNTLNSTSANLEPAKSNTCTSVELLGRLQQDIDSIIAALSATQLPSKQAALFADEMQRAQVIHNTLKDNINDDDGLFISNVINRVMEILGEMRATAQTEPVTTRRVCLPEDYNTKDIENKDDYFVVICKTDELMPVIYHSAMMLMRKNFEAQIGDVVIVNNDITQPRLEFCTVEGIYPAVCVAAKPQLLEILPDGTASKAA